MQPKFSNRLNPDAMFTGETANYDSKSVCSFLQDYKSNIEFIS
jgi:hypothetical protein